MLFRSIGGRYRLVETAAPDGFITPEGYWIIEMDLNGEITITPSDEYQPNIIWDEDAEDWILDNERETDLSIAKSSIPIGGATEADAVSVGRGHNIDYIVTVSNDGGLATNVFVIDEIPEHLTITPDLDNPIRGYFYGEEEAVVGTIALALRGVRVTVDGQLVEWRIDELATGEYFTLVIPTRVNINTPYPTIFRNQAFITGYNDVALDEDDWIYSEVVYHAVDELTDPSIDKTSDAEGPVLRGEVITYELTVSNPNTVALGNHVVVDNLANGRLDAETIANVVVTPATALYDWNVVDGELVVELNYLPAATVGADDELISGTVVITFEIEVAADAPVGNLVNTAYLYDEDDNPIDDDDDIIVVEDLDPSIDKISDVEGPVLRGEVITYELTVSNPNTVPLGNHVVVDNLANGRLDAETIANVVVTPATALYEWSVVDGELVVELNYLPAAMIGADDELIPGTVVITFEIEVSADAPTGNLVNTAYLYDEDDNPIDDDDDIIVVERETPTLPPTITKTALVDGPVFFGQFVEYRLVVTNPNDFVLADHLVIDNLANGRLTEVRNVSVYPEMPFTHIIYYNALTELDELRVVLDLPADSDVIITFEARVVAAGEVVNTAYIFADEDDVVINEDGDREGYEDKDDDRLVIPDPDPWICDIGQTVVVLPPGVNPDDFDIYASYGWTYEFIFIYTGNYVIAVTPPAAGYELTDEVVIYFPPGLTPEDIYIYVCYDDMDYEVIPPDDDDDMKVVVRPRPPEEEEERPSIPDAGAIIAGLTLPGLVFVGIGSIAAFIKNKKRK